jgi:hypothetical protein
MTAQGMEGLVDRGGFPPYTGLKATVVGQVKLRLVGPEPVDGDVRPACWSGSWAACAPVGCIRKSLRTYNMDNIDPQPT